MRAARQHKAHHRVEELQIGKQLKQRHQHRDKGNHHGQHQNAHHSILALVVVNLKAVARHGAYQQRQEGLKQTVDQGVFHGAAYVLLGKKVFQVLCKVGARQHSSA